MAAVLSPDHQAPLAAIDLGSNSFRLEIARLVHGRYQRIVYLKETVRLGAGLDATGALTEEAVERGLACLRRFAARLSGLHIVDAGRGFHPPAGPRGRRSPASPHQPANS